MNHVPTISLVLIPAGFFLILCGVMVVRASMQRVSRLADVFSLPRELHRLFARLSKKALAVAVLIDLCVMLLLGASVAEALSSAVSVVLLIAISHL